MSIMMVTTLLCCSPSAKLDAGASGSIGWTFELGFELEGLGPFLGSAAFVCGSMTVSAAAFTLVRIRRVGFAPEPSWSHPTARLSEYTRWAIGLSSWTAWKWSCSSHTTGQPGTLRLRRTSR